VDSLQGSGAVRIELIWNFPPNFARQKNNLIGDNQILVSFSCKNSGQVVPHTQAEQYTYSGSYGEGEHACRILVKFELSLPCTIETQFIVQNFICVE